MINKRVNGLTVFLLLVSVIAPVFFATRSLAEATDTPIELISFKLIEHQDQQLTAELSLSVPESQDEQQITLDISDNYLIDSENLPVIDQETKETIGNCTYQNRQINLDFNPMTKDTTVEIQLKGDYLSDENDLYVEHSATNQRLIIQQDQLQQSDSKINDSSDSVKKKANVQGLEPSTSFLPLSSSLTLHADLNEAEIVDGTENFDVNSNPGNDASPNNQIVRSFDTITYPIKMTLNDSSGGTLNNIRIKVTGTLHNGIVAGRTNAVFADNSINDYTHNTVTFEDEYVVGATGNAVTFPVVVNVLGADNGTVLQPEFHVQVISIDGVDVTSEDIKADFTQVIPRTVSSKVSIAPKISHGTVKFASQTLVTADTFNKNHRTIPLGVELMAVPLLGKTDIKGAAFPRDDLQMELNLKGRVVWDNHVKPVHDLDFNSIDQSPFIIDHHNYIVNTGSNLISSNPNTWSNTANVEYKLREFNDSRSYWAGSKRSDKASYDELNSIWDSGKYEIDQYDLKNEVTIDVKNYQIGASYPVRRADGYTGRTVYGPNEKVFTNQNLDLLLSNDYTYQGSLNPEKLDNTLYYNATLSFIDDEGETKESFTEFAIRNEVPGLKGTLSANFKNPDTGLPFGKYTIANDIDPYGDGQTVSGAKVALSSGGTFGDTTVEGGYQYLQKWNTDAFRMTNEDFNSNELLLQSVPVFGSIGYPHTGKGYWYGISKKTNPNSLGNLKTANVTDYDWYDGATIASNQTYDKVGAVLIDCRLPIARTWKYNASNNKKGVQLTIITEKLGSSTTKDTPNIYVAEMDVFRDENRPLFNPDNPSASYNEPSRYSISNGYAIHKETKYDEDNKLVSLQEPAQGHTKFDTLGIVPVKVSNAIEAERSTYHSTENAKWTIHDNGLIASKNYNEEDEIFWTVTLPPGLSYQYGSGKYDQAGLEPTVITNPDKSQTLIWTIKAVSTPEETALLKNIEFETNFDDININYTNNVAELTVQSIISTEKDTSQDELRTATATINVMNIGRLGIYQTITPPVEEVNQAYTLSIVPYSTMREEEKVRGIIPLPKDGSYSGNNFEGQNELTGIQTDIDPGKSIAIYLNDSLVTEKNPNLIDTTQNGWYLYTGSSQDLSNVQTVLYEYQQKLQPKELTAIHLDLKNKQNSYGNSYRHQAFGNSLSDYKVPISSNIVEHSVKGRRISGKVWLDENRDGQLQSAEPKLKNVPVSLYRKDGSNYVLVLKNLRDESLKGIKTDAAGNYAFEYLATGEYIVSFDQKASVLKNKKITTFDTGDKATSSKVDKDNQLSGITGWNTVLSEDFPLLKDMADNCYEQINLHLGVYTVNVPPPKPPDPLDPPEPSKPPGPAPSTTDDSNSSTTSNSSGKDSSTSESSETEKSGVGGIGGKNIPPGSQINRKDLPVTNSKRSLLPKTNDLSGTLFIVFGVCLLILSGSILIKRSKQSK
ncbi:SdrD B-like domain-containing protein [Enterococcus sp. AZ072]|uniref:SdrD B-like domain-containing protein n=1 Tax=unclassified Enterococcus TaxID=2608891 RepID=UPI003D2C6F12